MKELKKLDVKEDVALDKILNISPKTYEYKDVINRGTNRVYGFISQQIAEITPVYQLPNNTISKKVKRE
jgi:hypothetical protein